MAAAAPQSGTLLARWHAYALNRITPHFDWAPAQGSAVAPTVLDVALSNRRSLANHAYGASGDSSLVLRLDVGAAAISVDHGRTEGAAAAPLLDALAARSLHGSIAKPGVVASFGSSLQLGASAVLANQRFAAPVLDGYAYALNLPHSGAGAWTQTSHGAGLQLRLTDTVAPRLNWFMGYRSRISMDAFQNYRGIYGKPGDMDIPAQMHVGLGWQAAPHTQWRVAVDRVMYSGTRPFISASLPRRLLAVLGSGNSPVFRWRDLDIFSVSLAHEFGSASRVSLRYSTRQQPHATSALIDGVLNQYAAPFAVAASYSRDLSANSQWRLMANYAPAEFVFGLPGSVRTPGHSGMRQIEFETIWTMRF